MPSDQNNGSGAMPRSQIPLDWGWKVASERRESGRLEGKARTKPGILDPARE